MPDDDPRTTWPLPLIEQQFGIRKGCDVHYTENCKFKAALAPADMPTLYNLWDCFLYLSGGEGFGIPAWEAMCASLPVVHTNYSSHSEFLRKANGGIPIGGLLQPEAKTCIGVTGRIKTSQSEAGLFISFLLIHARGLALS